MIPALTICTLLASIGGFYLADKAQRQHGRRFAYWLIIGLAVETLLLAAFSAFVLPGILHARGY